MSTRPYIPRATYRMQFNQHFTFNQAAELVPYLADLGISHCYASPILKARPGSTHGYDIVDHNSINPEIGTPEEFTRFVDALHGRGMGLILDIVPNHMGIMGSDNAWWLDVLENGEASTYSSYFDIDWLPLKDELRHKVLVPVLGDAYGVALENGSLKLTFDRDRGEFSLFYYNHRFPIDPREYPRILQKCADKLAETGDTVDSLEFQSLVSSFSHLPNQLESLPEKVAERNRDKEIHKRRLAELATRSSPIAGAIDERLRVMNGKPGDAASFEELHELIKAQAFRLAHWRVAIDDINYRRFFDINDLAALRMEDQAVYDATHRLVLQWMAEGKVDGLRIDHPDGLYDPAQYFQRLQSSFASLTPCDEGSGVSKTCRFLAIEKILTGGEHLPPQWPVSGTSGYDFTNLINGLFVEPSASTKMEATYRAFLGERIDFEEVVYTAKKLIIRYRLASEVNVLANQLSRIALSRRLTCDFTLNGLRDAITEVVACFPIYRTYVTAEGASSEDRQVIETAVSLAKWRNAAAETSIFDFLHEVLTTRIAEGQNRSYQCAVVALAMKFQQFSSPVMAKGLEDTAFYRYTRLLSLNEVGGDPRKFGTVVPEFHRANEHRLKHWPHTMLATTTHDTKRSEDARLRIDVLSEVPALWRLRLRHWKRLNRTRSQTVGSKPAPSLNEEYLLYQTLVGVWPYAETEGKEQWRGLIDRVSQYMIKALREAKENTSWINPNLQYETAVSSFVAKILTPGRKNRFLDDFLPFQRYVAQLGLWNSLSQTLLKLTVPGIPDFYQGSELWDFRLVDPDNRNPVDYEHRGKFLEELKAGADGPELLRRLLATGDARIKLYLIWKTLNLRRQNPGLFAQGEYLPLEVVGEKSKHICSFARTYGGVTMIVVAPRLLASILGEAAGAPIGPAIWSDTSIVLPQNLTQSKYTSLYGGGNIAFHDSAIRVSDILSDFPVGLLISEPN